MRSLTIAALGLLLLEGCALTPRGQSLQQREKLYNERLARVRPGQTRAYLHTLFPPLTPAQPRTTGLLKPTGHHFTAEKFEIDSDFFFMVTFDYHRYRQVADPSLPTEAEERKRGIYSLTLRQFPRGTPFYRLYPDANDTVQSVSSRVTRTNSSLVYVPLDPLNR